MDLKSFNSAYKNAMTSIRCPNCGCHLGLVKGIYSLRCGKCKAHCIVTGNTETGEQRVR